MSMPIDVETLLNRQRIESERIEFKRGWNPTGIYRTICAFANDLVSTARFAHSPMILKI